VVETLHKTLPLRAAPIVSFDRVVNPINLLPREVPLGGQRAIYVRRTLPHRDLAMIGAFCFIDHYGSSDSGRGPHRPMVVPPHPHIGLQTVSWLLDGAIDHRDSLGSVRNVRPGQLSLMTAGMGIAHSEYSGLPGTSATGRHEPAPLHGVQLWIALPDATRHQAPHFEHHPRLPVVNDRNFTATVILGSFMGETSEARAYSTLVCAEITLAGRACTLPLDQRLEHGLLPLDSDIEVGTDLVPRGALRYEPPGSKGLTVAAATKARVLLVGGEPFGEDVLMWWNFVARDHDEIVQARSDWQSGDRFGVVDGDDHPPLAAPEIPHVRLRPRPPHPR
jgi:redox-sensitive bicupin YhaK (pirin superfamily)